MSAHLPLGVARALAACVVSAAVIACSSPTAPSPVTMEGTGNTNPTPTPQPTPDPTARYTVRFQSSWSAATHPNDFPSNPHFSPLIGVTHNGSVRFWADGTIATDGIKRMAELGAVSPLDAEMQAAIDGGAGGSLIRGGGLDSPGELTLEFQASTTFPRITLVTMIAPSPDWFVGVSGLNLLPDGSDWTETLTVELFPWDAGTDAGPSYTSPDAPLEPRQPITRIQGPPFAVSGSVAPLATFTFSRVR